MMQKHITQYALVALILLVSPQASIAQIAVLSSNSPEEKTKEDIPQTHRLTVTPAAEPVPALKHRFTWRYIDQKQGNAAVALNQLTGEFAEVERSLASKDEKSDGAKTPRADEMSTLPDSEFSIDEAKKTIGPYNRLLDRLVEATRYDTCDWQHGLRESDSPYDILLPELNKTRHFVRLLSLRARIEIEEGRYDDAIRTIRAGIELGRYVGSEPLLVSKLVDIAIQGIVLEQQVVRLIEQPGSPNMYWALTQMPRSHADFGPALDYEGTTMLQAFPELSYLQNAGPETPARTEAEWQTTTTRFNQITKQLLGQEETLDLASVARTLTAYPRAMQYLINNGYTPDQVGSLPVMEVIARCAVKQYIVRRDNMFKWMSLPYYQVANRLSIEGAKLDLEGKQDVIPIASVLLPAISAMKMTEAKTERRLDMLIIVEAIRMYAAENDGQLPAKLSDITSVVIPAIDPMHGTPYQYSLEGDTAVIESDAPEGLWRPAWAVRYEIQIAK